MNETIWLLDLDNTLHNADVDIFYLINRRMTGYLAGRLNLPEEEASCLRQDYWHHCDAMLAGLQVHHPEIDVGNFLRQSHLPDEILAKLTPIEGAEETSSHLRSRKTVFLNGPLFYVRTVVNVLGLGKYSDLSAGIEGFGLLYKPDRHAYLNVCRLLVTYPTACITTDDNADNLHAAKMLGMRTVRLGRHVHLLPFTDAVVSSTVALAERDDNAGP